MVVVSSNNGLANKMFQYAFYLALRAKGISALWDQHLFKPRSNMTCETTHLQDVFKNVRPVLYEGNEFKYSYVKRRWHLLLGLSGYFTGYHYCFEKGFTYDPDFFKKVKKNCVFIGHWQTEKYFLDIRENILDAFKFPEIKLGKNLELAQKMKFENAVAVHVRKGKDYQRELLFEGTCPKEYYLESIDYMKRNLDSPVFYVFTDNPEWVLENLPGFQYTLVNWNPVSGKENYLDMQMMSLASHNIISNSTYSWWAAWLNSNPDKIVIAPEKWFNPAVKQYNPNEVVPDKWIKL